MKNNQGEYLDQISDKLAWLATKVKQENKINWTSTATRTEGFYREFLNALYGWKLTNANIQKRNAKGIDLLFLDQRIIVQVSSTNSYNKIQSTLTKIDPSKYCGYHLIFLAIGSKRDSYKAFKIPQGIQFDADEDIWDNSHLLNRAGNTNIETLERLADMIEKYYGDMEKNMIGEDDVLDASDESFNNDFIGHCVKFGMTCCRVFQIFLGEEDPLKEIDPIPYHVDVPSQNDRQACKAFLDDIIGITNNDLRTIKESNRFVKVLADAEFVDLFPEKKDIDSFVERYYQNTGYYFNILTQKQTENNMKALFPNLEGETAIVDICSTCVHVVIKKKGAKASFKSFMIKISTQDVKNNIPKEGLSDSELNRIKEYIKGRIGDTFKSHKAKKAIIIKDERSFMKKMGYRLIVDGLITYIDFEDYIADNRKKLYNKNFKEKVQKAYEGADENTLKKYYGFKEGHIILETIFEILGVSTIIPTDVPNILRSPLANVFNVVLSGSTKPDHIHYMHEAHRIFTEIMKVNVSSPTMDNLMEKSKDSYLLQKKSIKECDLLFVCNGDGYIGQQTKCDIYGASLLSKPIAYWCNPKNNDAHSDEFNYSDYIPHDLFQGLMNEYYHAPSGAGNKRTLKGCVIGSFRKYYEDIVNVINAFNKQGIEILSPKVSRIVNPDAQFVKLATDDENMTEPEIQSQVFEHERESDFVYVWDPDGYIGRTTCYEIGRIIERGTPIYYKERPKDIPLEIAEGSIMNIDDLIRSYVENGDLPKTNLPG